MIIQPNTSEQLIEFRTRPHDEQTGYVAFAWVDTDKIYPIIVSTPNYSDGYLSCMFGFPEADRLANGSKITMRVYGFDNLSEITTAIETLRDASPYYGTTVQIHELIEAQDSNLTPELFRGLIFVSDRSEQPYNIT